MKGLLKRAFLDTYLPRLAQSIIGKHITCEGHLLLKMLKVLSRFLKWRKSFRKRFFFVDNYIWISCLKLPLLKKRILAIGSQCVNKQSKDFTNHWERLFPIIFHSFWSITILKVLLCRFKQCLKPFNMLSVEKSSETSIFRHLPNHVFPSP